jgi:hypothetical protein
VRQLREVEAGLKEGPVGSGGGGGGPVKEVVVELLLCLTADTPLLAGTDTSPCRRIEGAATGGGQHDTLLLQIEEAPTRSDGGGGGPGKEASHSRGAAGGRRRPCQPGGTARDDWGRREVTGWSGSGQLVCRKEAVSRECARESLQPQNADVDAAFTGASTVVFFLSFWRCR